MNHFGLKIVLPGFNDPLSHPIESGVEHLKKVPCDTQKGGKLGGAKVYPFVTGLYP
ncbi:MAG TPA: hypothetical protein VFE51_06530 [Verrucomicrobiae bacterium]|nr:hypothetical protein [Verrucomicrobiae bacterium]